MDKKKKEIRIIKSDSNKEDYTFVSRDNITLLDITTSTNYFIP